MSQPEPGDVRVGDALPELVIDVTRTVIVAGAIATQDFEDVHHDPDLAVARGTRDVYLSINTTNGFLGRYATDWAGPGARITRLRTRLGVPNLAGMPLTLSGRVTAVDGPRVTIEIRGTNRDGVHATCSCDLLLSAKEE